MLKQHKFHTMFFYDAKGSELYENITKQPEYYLTKTEAALIVSRGGCECGEADPCVTRDRLLWRCTRTG